MFAMFGFMCHQKEASEGCWYHLSPVSPPDFERQSVGLIRPSVYQHLDDSYMVITQKGYAKEWTDLYFVDLREKHLVGMFCQLLQLIPHSADKGLLDLGACDLGGRFPPIIKHLTRVTFGGGHQAILARTIKCKTNVTLLSVTIEAWGKLIVLTIVLMQIQCLFHLKPPRYEKNQQPFLQSTQVQTFIVVDAIVHHIPWFSACAC